MCSEGLEKPMVHPEEGSRLMHGAVIVNHHYLTCLSYVCRQARFETPLLDDGLGQAPEAGYRVEDHQHEHRQLASESAYRVAQETQRDRMGEIDCDHMPGHDES